jgi:hypothetical protein
LINLLFLQKKTTGAPHLLDTVSLRGINFLRDILFSLRLLSQIRGYSIKKATTSLSFLEALTFVAFCLSVLYHPR